MTHLRRVTDKRHKFVMADRLYNRIPEPWKRLIKTDAALAILRKDYSPLTLDYLLGNKEATVRTWEVRVVSERTLESRWTYNNALLRTTLADPTSRPNYRSPHSPSRDALGKCSLSSTANSADVLYSGGYVKGVPLKDLGLPPVGQNTPHIALVDPQNAGQQLSLWGRQIIIINN